MKESNKLFHHWSMVPGLLTGSGLAIALTITTFGICMHHTFHWLPFSWYAWPSY